MISSTSATTSASQTGWSALPWSRSGQADGRGVPAGSMARHRRRLTALADLRTLCQPNRERESGHPTVEGARMSRLSALSRSWPRGSSPGPTATCRAACTTPSRPGSKRSPATGSSRSTTRTRIRPSGPAPSRSRRSGRTSPSTISTSCGTTTSSRSTSRRSRTSTTCSGRPPSRSRRSRPRPTSPTRSCGFLAGYDLGELLSYKGIAEGVENSNFLSTPSAGATS